jgi:bacterioferritin (cytochrome b1)
MSSKTDLVAQLNALLRLTNTEIMIAETRRAQAARDEIERELATNADMGRERARMLADSIRQLGGVPDVVGVVAGRLVATAKTAVEQGQDVLEAVLGDLTLEHELLDRTRLATMIVDQLELRPPRRTLERLERAHTETIDWLMTRLAEIAAGGPAALRPTPLQSVVGFSRRLGMMPVRNTSGTVNRSIESAGRLRRQAGDTVKTNGDRVRELVVAARDIWTTGRNASLKRTEEIADERGDKTQAQAVNRRRRQLGAVDSTELAIREYDSMRSDAVTKRIDRLAETNDVQAILAYESEHKARKGVIAAAQGRLGQLAAQLAAAS